MTIAYLNVRDLMDKYLGASDVFRRHGIDFYRIGGMTLSEVADRQHLGLDVIIGELSNLPANPAPLPTSMLGLMTYIDARYYAVHRKQLRKAIGLAKLIAANPVASGLLPSSFPTLLVLLLNTLESHQDREEGSLFSSMMTPGQQNLKFPIMHAMREHDDISDQLDTLSKLAGGYNAPVGAGRPLQRLYEICGNLDGELRQHMHLENNLLFPPFLGEPAGTEARAS